MIKAIEGTDRTLGDLLSSETFLIPLNQRGWAWNLRNMERLWKDVLQTALEHKKLLPGDHFEFGEKEAAEPHFIGFMVICTERGLEVFDGQQRLTTSVVIVSCLRELATELLTGSLDTSVRTRLNSAHTRLGLCLANATTGKPTLSVDAWHNDLFQDYVVQSSGDGTRQEARERHADKIETSPRVSSLLKSIDSLREVVRGDAPSSPDDVADWVSLVTRTLDSEVLLLDVRVASTRLAMRVYDRLNGNNVALSKSDLVKNRLFELVGPDDIHALKSNWDDLASAVPNENLTQFLLMRHGVRHGTVTEAQLVDEISKTDITPASSAVQVAKFMLGDARNLKKLRSPTHGELGKPLCDVLTPLSTALGSPAWAYPLLYRARDYWSFSSNDFRKLAESVVAFIFRRLTISQVDVSILAKDVCETAALLAPGVPVSDVIDALNQRSPDGEFRDNFATYSTRSPSVQFYILQAMESYLVGGAGVASSLSIKNAKNHIEHIAPRNPSKRATRLKEWEDFRPGLPDRPLINRLGNLVLLEEDINKDVSNYPFTRKRDGYAPTSPRAIRKKGYKDSSFVMAAGPSASSGAVAPLQPLTSHANWTDAEITTRQKEMADVALHVWRL